MVTYLSQLHTPLRGPYDPGTVLIQQTPNRVSGMRPGGQAGLATTLNI